MKKTLFLTIVSFSLCINAFAQTTQQYKGPFGTGKATYDYYENAQADRIYNGAFSYAGDLFSYTGKFKDNNRQGLWKISALNKVYANDKKIKVQHNAGVSGIYTAGKMDSTWNYVNTIKFFNPKTKKPGTKVDKIVSKAQFTNNHFVGAFSYERTTPAGKTVCTGQFDAAGFPDGVWSIKSAREIEEIKFQNGIKISYFKKDLTTGDKKQSSDSTEFVKSFWKNFDESQKMAIVDQKMYFLDTAVLHMEVLDIWTNEKIDIKDFGLSRNPLYDFKKGQQMVTVYELRIISCDINTDCFKKYQERKNVEAERQKQIQAEEEARRQQEILSREEEMRKEKERQLEEQRKLELSLLTQNGDDLYNRKKYREARAIYEQVNAKETSAHATERIAEIDAKLVEIDKSHQYRTSLYDELQKMLAPVDANTKKLEADLKARKKVYATNFGMCMESMLTSVQPKMEQMELVNDVKSNPELLNVWTEADQESVVRLEEIKKEVVQITNFQNAVAMALSTGNKAHLRVLNSSLNPKIIINDMINFK